MADTVWTQCLLQLSKLNEIRLASPDGLPKQGISMEEVDRLALLVTHEMKANVEMTIMKIIQNPANGFDDPVPF